MGIAVTLRRDGMPIALPTWYAVFDRHIYLRTPPKAKKLDRVRRDPRGSFLVEAGSRWAELKAVHLTGVFVVEGYPPRQTLVNEAIDAKYAHLRTADELLPEGSQRHYADQRVVLRFDHNERILSWDNSKLRLKVAD
jgi:hypothetical protein